MSNYYGQQPQSNYGPSSNNLQFFPSSYTPGVQGSATPSQGGTGDMEEEEAAVLRRRTRWLAAFSTEGYDGEPPLLEELGVNFGHIQAKTLAVLNPFGRVDQHLMDDSDLAGPILFFLLFGTFLLFSGKVHFGYIYGLALLGSTSLHAILSLMTPPDIPPSPSYHDHPPGSSSSHHDHPSQTLTFARSGSVLGYCLLPLVVTSMVGIVMPMDTPAGIVCTCAAVLWCTASSSGMFCAVGRMRGMRALVAYPLALFYFGFGIMAIFSSRGSGSLAKLQKA